MEIENNLEDVTMQWASQTDNIRQKKHRLQEAALAAGRTTSLHCITLIALMADLVTDIILARDIGGFISIMENN